MTDETAVAIGDITEEITEEAFAQEHHGYPKPEQMAAWLRSGADQLRANPDNQEMLRAFCVEGAAMLVRVAVRCKQKLEAQRSED